MSDTLIQRSLFILILVGYLIVAIAFAIRTPDWQTPDEPAHYNYIAQIAEEGKLPQIEMGDWDQAYLNALTGSRFDPTLLDNLAAVQYEDHQPPLYYLLAGPIYIITGGSLTVLRLFSAAWGIVIVYCAMLIGHLMFPQRPWVSLAAAAFVAFLPQHVHILASVNNDALAWAIVAATLWMTVAYVKSAADIKPWQMGLMVGIGLITKATTYFLLALVPLALLLRWWVKKPSQNDTTKNETNESTNRQLWRSLIAFALPALSLGMIWWLRNIAVYGFPDLLGLREHDAVVIGQPRTAELIARIGWGDYLREISGVTLNSFVGRFGWMGVPMSGWPYTLILVLMGLGLAGLLLNGLWQRERLQMDRSQLAAWILLATTIGLSVLAYLYYNIEFQQHQGRYMYPLLIPLGLLLALGVDTWRRLLLHRVAFSQWLTPLLFMGLAPLCLWLLWRVIVPNLAF